MGHSTESFYGEKLQLVKSKAVNVTVNGAVVAIEKCSAYVTEGTEERVILIARE